MEAQTLKKIKATYAESKSKTIVEISKKFGISVFETSRIIDELEIQHKFIIVESSINAQTK